MERDPGHTARRDDLAWVDELGVNECWRLLAAVPVGRLGFVQDGRPMILPVSHALDGEHVVFRTDDDSSLGRLVPGEPVAYEVDGLDLATRTGWSVVVQGELECIARRDRRPDAVVPWIPSAADRWWRIGQAVVSGRRLHRHLPDASGHYRPMMPPD